jgi:hypothetical protein
MMATATKTFAVRAIPADVVAELRVRDDSEREPELVVDRDGGSPLRCCLRASRPGEEMFLVSYSPLRRWAAQTGANPGAYVETGPVFIHTEPCDGAEHDGWPQDFRGLPRVLRAYGADGRIRGGVVVPPGESRPERFIDELFTDADVAFVHARAVEFGCFTFWIDKRVETMDER